ncbi:MAG: hypothetical protein DRQ51_08005 [Gammaproteobacteria bacterium]|nr:MAG: hypothetical protein DRQ51_08005 [Gammaproteobacteria bacterium]
MNIIHKTLLSIVLIFLSSCTNTQNYQPRNGDIIFQSSGDGQISRMIEYATKSWYSHSGLVVKKNNNWFVREAVGPVKDTPLKKWQARGKNKWIDVYRLKKEYQKHIPAMIKNSAKYLGRPYDKKYKFDDKKIYCSELIFKAYKDSTKNNLGQIVTLDQLDYKKFTKQIKIIEGGKVPLKRKMITPWHLSQAHQLKLTYSNKK